MRSARPDLVERIKAFLEHAREKEHVRCTDRQKNKFEILQNKAKNQANVCDEVKEKWVVNISSKQLTEQQKSVLQKGMNFAITPTSLPSDEIIVPTEVACASLSETQANSLRTKVASALTSAKIKDSNLSKSERNVLKELKQDDSILVLPADKGRSTVIMDKSDYNQKAENMLSDRNTYAVLKNDPTATVKRQLIAKLKQLKEGGVLTQQQYRSLIPTAERALKFYGLPKIHKPLKTIL